MYIRRDDKISIKLSDLKITGIEYLRLINFEIVEKAHTHGICNLVVAVDSKLDTNKILSWNKTQVTIKADKEIIFCGIITQCKLDARVDVRILELTLKSLSCKLESARSSATFQNAKKKLSDMLSTVKKNHNPAEISCWKDETIAAFFYRDNLSDWEFLTELAESHGQILFANSKTDKLTVSVGFKSFKKFKADTSMRLLRREVSIETFKRLEENTYSGARSCYFVDTDLFTHDATIGVGCSVNYENADQAVIAARTYVYEGVLCNEIRLRHAEGCRADAWDVVKYFDRFYYLTGKSLEAKDTNIKVQFDCDDKQDKSEALDIPYESAVNNYFYVMPDDNDKVFVYADTTRQAVMGSLRSKSPSDDYKNRSFSHKTNELKFEPKKTSLTVDKKTSLTQEGDVKFDTPKNIILSAKGDIIIQSAQGMLPDGQLTMAAPHFAGYAQYLAGLGQPATVQFNPAGSTVGKLPTSIKNAGSKAEKVELSDLAKELDKLTGRKNQTANNSTGGGGSGGSINITGKTSALVQVSDSSIEMKSKNLNVKTPALIQVGYIPMPGGGTGSLSKFEGGNPKNRSDKINAEHGSKDRSRSKEKIPATPDNKNISR